MKKKNAPIKIYLQSVLFKKALLVCFAIFTLIGSYAQKTSTGSGAWNVAATWTPSGVPGNNDIVTIAAGHTVTVPANATCKHLFINGTLNMTGSGITMDITNNSSAGPTNGLQLNAGSSLTIGAANTLYFSGTQAAGIVNNGGTIVSSGVNGEDGGTILSNTNSDAEFRVSGSAQTTVYNLKFLANTNFNLQSGGLHVNGIFTVPNNQFRANSSTLSPIYGPASTLYINRGSQGIGNGNPFNNELNKLWSVQSGTIGSTPGYPNNITLVNFGTSSGNVGGINVGWRLASGTYGMNGILRMGDGTGGSTGSVVGSLDQVTGFTCGGIIVDNNSTLIGPPAGAAFIDNGDFILTGATKGIFVDKGATINFAGSGTSASPQKISGTGSTITFAGMSVSNGTYVLLQDPVNTGTLTLSSGYIGTSTTFPLTVTNTATTAITGGGTNAYVDGPLSWNLPASAAGPYIFPVGDLSHNGGAYLPLTLSSANSAGGNTFTATAFNQNAGGSFDATISAISSTEYWSVSTSSAFTSGALINAQRPNAVSPNNSLASSSTKTGQYTAIGGSPNTGTPGIISGGGIGSDSPTYIAMVNAYLNVVRVGGAMGSVDASCNPTTGSLIVGGVGGTPSYTYSVDGSAFTATTTYNGLTVGPHTVIVKDNLGNTATQTLHVVGALQINGNNQDVTICSGASATLTASNLQNPSPSYSWTSSPAGFTSASPTINPSPAVATTYTVSSTVYSTNLLIGGDFESGPPTGFVADAAGYYTTHAPYTGTPDQGGHYAIGTAGSALCTCFSSLTAKSGSSFYMADGYANTSVTNLFSIPINGLTPGTTYKLSFWYAQATSNPNFPKLDVIVSGGTITSGPGTLTINDATSWAQATYDITASSTSITLTFNDPVNLGHTDGNDIFLDNMEFLAPCTVTTSVTVTPGPCCPKGIISGSAQICDDGTSTTQLSVSFTGTAPWTFTYAIDGVNQTPITTSSATYTFQSATGAHTYTLTNVQDAVYTACTGNYFGSADVTASVPSAPTVTVTDPTCTVSTGSLQVTAPVSGVEYSFDNGSTYAASATQSGLAPGSYQVKVRTTTNQCESAATSKTIAAALVVPVAPTVTVTDPTCTVSTGSLQVTAPVSGVEYSFDNGATYAVSATQSGLAPGSYQVKVRSTSAGQCESAATGKTIAAALVVPAAPTVTVTDPTCTVSTGSLQVTAPASGVEYSFDNGATYAVSVTKSGLTPGSYQVKVRSTSAGQCESAATGKTIAAALVVPAAPTVTVTDPTCTVSTGSLQVTVPASGVEYSFDNGSTYAASATKSGLAAGSYQVKVRSTSAGQCESAATGKTITALVVPAAPTVTVTDPTCTVSTGSLEVTAPVSGVEYSFDNGLTYAASATQSGLAPGSYQVKVRSTSTGQCESVTTSKTIAAALVVPAAPTVTVTDPTCIVSTGSLQVTAPVSGVEYSFDNGATYAASATKSGLAGGITYQVKVRSTVGQCESVAAGKTIAAALVIPAAPTVIVTDPTCTVSIGSLQITVPASGVEYSFDNGATYSASAAQNGLTPGNYQVKVRSTSTGQCESAVTTKTIAAQPTTPLTPTVSVTQPTCNELTGTITISNWDASYSYSIDGGTTFSAGPNFSGLTPNTSYNNIIARNDNGGCLSPAASATVNAAPVIPIANAGPDIQVDDFTTVTLNGSASSAGNYNWTSSDPSAIITDPAAAVTIAEPKAVITNFILTVTDPANPGCQSSDVVRVIISPKPVEIPDAFSPNGDGIHDLFEIRNIDFFQDAILYVYNQWGELIFESEPGYKDFWDGTRNGKAVSVGGYYYILELNMAEFKSITGSITLIK